ncbi:hypothetical protein GR925_36150 [Streptomyces sp. HUCO-GS316]|uniref:hypothetical protein n=1 Tax=Streptomyces sp. HUCO-GS316 TaxID=2692198 RepID=UPI00136FE531|nr:hypothetical protein [Streptomyces sp. HUCO-GS316]MXM68701.1 hypothetical protein [Streptomyces sp. HUCO-GS316]
MKHVAKDHQLAQVYLQAAVAQAALGEFDEARHRLDTVLALPLEDLLAMAHTVAAYVDSLTVATGSEFATGKPAESGEMESLDERVPSERALTLRLMSAWSSNDVASFDALFTAAAGDRVGAQHVGDLFVYALEVTEYKAASAANPQAMVKAICKDEECPHVTQGEDGLLVGESLRGDAVPDSGRGLDEEFTELRGVDDRGHAEASAGSRYPPGSNAAASTAGSVSRPEPSGRCSQRRPHACRPVGGRRTPAGRWAGAARLPAGGRAVQWPVGWLHPHRA